MQTVLLPGIRGCMIVENEGWDQTEVFLRLLLIGGLYTPSNLKDQSAYFQETLRKCGITLYSSDFSVLDRALHQYRKSLSCVMAQVLASTSACEVIEAC